MRAELLKLLCLPVIVVLLVDTWMYWLARRELKGSNQPWDQHFRFHRSEFAWVGAYLKLARSRGLPTWPAYVNRVSWIAIAGTLGIWVLSHI